jgi:hypothetical protein
VADGFIEPALPTYHDGAFNKQGPPGGDSRVDSLVLEAHCDQNPSTD